VIVSNLAEAIRILLAFYLIAGIHFVITGELPTVIEIPEISIDNGTVDAVISAVVGVLNTVIALMTAPVGVILLINTGILALDIIIKAVMSAVVLYAYLVLFAHLKNLLNPLASA